MHQLGLKVARACERDDLVQAVGEIGSVIYGQSRLKAAQAAPEVEVPAGRGKGAGRPAEEGQD